MAQATITFSLGNLLTGALAPLYCKYPSQCNPQPAFVEMDEDGEVSADYSADSGGTPSHVWHNRTMRWAVPAEVNGKTLADLLQGDEVRGLLERIHAGHSVDWDGSNHRGTLDGDAQDASYDLERRLERLAEDPTDLDQVWSVGDWLFSSCSLAQHWENQSLDEAVAEIESAAEGEGVSLDGDVRECLLGKAQRMFDEDGDDGLNAVHLAALVAAGRITREEADARNAVTIQIGDRVEAGEGEGHDTGRVESIDGATAFVAWDSGVKTPADVASLRMI